MRKAFLTLMVVAAIGLSPVAAQQLDSLSKRLGVFAAIAAMVDSELHVPAN